MARPTELKIDDFNIDLDEFDDNRNISKNNQIFEPLATKKRIEKRLFYRAYSETQLFDILGIDILENGYSYHCLTNGNIDSLSFIKYILRQQDLRYLLFSTWCMAKEDIDDLYKWLIAGKVIRIDAYVGEIFPGSYSYEYRKLSEIIKKCGGRICVARNHSKIYAGYGNRYYFVIESSANINTNPRIENTTIIIDKELYYNYKQFFDNLKSYNRDFDDWRKWLDR